MTESECSVANARASRSGARRGNRRGRPTLHGTLGLPHRRAAVILFAHGSGSGRKSPRNQYVAQVLQEAGLGTLLIDLLEEEEASDRSKVFDIPLLAGRLQAAAALAGRPARNRGPAAWVFRGEHRGRRRTRRGRASTRLDRCDRLARRPPGSGHDALPRVTAPCLLIVGGNDRAGPRAQPAGVRTHDVSAAALVVPGATHLFPEPGALEEVAQRAKEWFLQYLVAAEDRSMTRTEAFVRGPGSTTLGIPSGPSRH